MTLLTKLPSVKKNMERPAARKLDVEVSRDDSSREYRKTLLAARLVVLFLFVAGLYPLSKATFATIRRIHTVRDLRIVVTEALAAVRDIEDIYNIPAELEGKLIHATGPLFIDEKLTYYECDVTASSVVLRRTIDKTHRYVKESEDELFFLSEKWPDTRIPDEGICTGSPGSQYEISSLIDYSLIADKVKIGNLILGDRLKEKIDQFFITTDKLYEISDIEAIRIMYSDAGRNGTIYSVLGQLVEGKIEPYYIPDYLDVILQEEFQVSAEDMITNRVNYRLKSIQQTDWVIYMLGLTGCAIHLMAAIYYTAMLKKLKQKYHQLNIIAG